MPKLCEMLTWLTGKVKFNDVGEITNAEDSRIMPAIKRVLIRADESGDLLIAAGKKLKGEEG